MSQNKGGPMKRIDEFEIASLNKADGTTQIVWARSSFERQNGTQCKLTDTIL